MKLAIDIGNSTIAFGFFSNQDVLSSFFKIKKDEIEEPSIACDHIRAELGSKNIDTSQISNIYLSSVVPTITNKIVKMLKNFFDCKINILTLNTSKLVDSSTVSSELGCDIYANLVSSRSKHPDKDLLVVDFGTATTISGVDRNGKIIGVSITSGVFTSIAALCSKAELLSSVIIDKPVLRLGKTTEESLVSGALFSAIGLLEACYSRSLKEFSTKPFVLATGGAGLILHTLAPIINEYDEYNTVYGIIKCFE